MLSVYDSHRNTCVDRLRIGGISGISSRIRTSRCGSASSDTASWTQSAGTSSGNWPTSSSVRTDNGREASRRGSFARPSRVNSTHCIESSVGTWRKSFPGPTGCGSGLSSTTSVSGLASSLQASGRCHGTTYSSHSGRGRSARPTSPRWLRGGGYSYQGCSSYTGYTSDGRSRRGSSRTSASSTSGARDGSYTGRRSVGSTTRSTTTSHGLWSYVSSQRGGGVSNGSYGDCTTADYVRGSWSTRGHSRARTGRSHYRGEDHGVGSRRTHHRGGRGHRRWARPTSYHSRSYWDTAIADSSS